MEKLIQSVEKEFELTKRKILIEIESFFKDGNQTSSRTNMKLKFRNKISQVTLTGEEIQGEGKELIEVALVEDQTENIVDDGREASASVEIVLLKGAADASEGDDWTIEEFNKKIVPEMEGKQPLLAGNVHLKLQRGIAVVEKIRFRHHASKIKPSVFKLGARVVGASNGSRIKEAKSESFTVKDFRNKYYKKHEIPSLKDEVPRLANIRKGGKIDKCLRDKKIYTVEDFLIQLLINPEELKSIVTLGEKNWEDTVKNARACVIDSRMYCYINPEQKMGIVFNVLGQVLGLYLESHYSLMVSENNKAHAQELLESAYKNWGNVKPFDDMNSLLHYFTDLSTHMDALDSVNPDYPTDGLENAGTS